VKEIDQNNRVTKFKKRERAKARSFSPRVSRNESEEEEDKEERRLLFGKSFALSARAFYFSRALLKQNINSVKRQLHTDDDDDIVDDIIASGRARELLHVFLLLRASSLSAEKAEDERCRSRESDE